jgi:hypothetical protein
LHSYLIFRNNTNEYKEKQSGSEIKKQGGKDGKNFFPLLRMIISYNEREKTRHIDIIYERCVEKRKNSYFPPRNKISSESHFSLICEIKTL